MLKVVSKQSTLLSSHACAHACLAAACPLQLVSALPLPLLRPPSVLQPPSFCVCRLYCFLLPSCVCDSYPFLLPPRALGWEKRARLGMRQLVQWSSGPCVDACMQMHDGGDRRRYHPSTNAMQSPNFPSIHPSIFPCLPRTAAMQLPIACSEALLQFYCGPFHTNILLVSYC